MISLDGRTLDSFGLILQPGHSHPILPQTKDVTIEIPGRHGAYDVGASLSPRIINLPLAWARETTRENLQQRIRELAAFLVDATGKPRTFKLTFDYESTINYNVRYSGSLDIDRFYKVGTFMLPLVAFDPFAYGSEIQQSFTTALNIDGTATALPIFEVNFTAASQDFKILQIETGKMVRVIHDFVAGDILVIDNEKRLITINGLKAMPSLDLDSEFFELMPGTNTFNTIPADVATLTVNYKPRWL
ncbi:phage distal tail protein [Tepidibacillus marianensis]|uniref:phage distal tail protein n=1 Tax=Tepidibacillus marianensis TaxID=3131995 RepID=UPI0030D590E6